MAIQQHYRPDLRLDREEPLDSTKTSLWTFLIDPLNSSETWEEWENYPIERHGYTIIDGAIKAMGKPIRDVVIPPPADDDLVPPDMPKIFPPLSLLYGVHETWAIIEQGRPHNQTVGEFDVVLPALQNIAITIYAAVLVKNGIDAGKRKIIEKAFDDYEYPRDGDPHDYARERMEGTGITRDDFEVVCTFAAKKEGKVIFKTGARDAMLAPYRNGTWTDDEGNVRHSPGVIYPEPPDYNTGRRPGDPFPPSPVDEGNNITEEFARRNLRPELVSSVLVRSLTPPAKHPNVIEAPKNPERAVADHAHKEGGKIEGCSGMDFVVQQYRIATISEFPEFKVVIRIAEIRVGCARIEIPYPVLQTRLSQLNLWAYTRYPDLAPENTSSWFINAIKETTFVAALAGGVVGIYSGNLAAAIKTFKSVFAEYWKAKWDKLVGCLWPSLAIVQETKPGEEWRDLYAHLASRPVQERA